MIICSFRNAHAFESKPISMDDEQMERGRIRCSERKKQRSFVSLDAILNKRETVVGVNVSKQHKSGFGGGGDRRVRRGQELRKMNAHS